MRTFPILIAGLGALALSVETAFAQFEFVDVRNGGINFPTTADRRVYTDVTHSQLLTDVNYAASLWYVPGNNTALLSDLNAGQHAGGFYPMRSALSTAPGTWLVTGSTQVVLPGVLEGGTAVLQIRVWDVTRYNSLTAAVADGGSYAVSCPFLYTIPQHETALPSSYYMDNLRAFPDVACVPEPAVGWLGAMGLFALVWARTARQVVLRSMASA